jgi:hypothetical protein
LVTQLELLAQVPPAIGCDEVKDRFRHETATAATRSHPMTLMRLLTGASPLPIAHLHSYTLLVWITIAA